MSDDTKPRPVHAWAVVWSDGDIGPVAYSTKRDALAAARVVNAKNCTVEPVIIMLESDYNDLIGGDDGSR